MGSGISPASWYEKDLLVFFVSVSLSLTSNTIPAKCEQDMTAKERKCEIDFIL